MTVAMQESEFVYRSLSRSAVYDQYRVTEAIANRADLLAGFIAASERYRQEHPGVTDLRFGPSVDETLDLFLPRNATPGAPVHVFIHGGYWYQFSKREWSFVAKGLSRLGAIVAIPSYSLAPGASLAEIIREMQGLVVWLHRNVRSWGGDPDRLYVSGHSAGGHMAVTLVNTPWRERFGLPDDVIKGATALSGVFDLRPLRFSHVQPQLRLDEHAALSLSPAGNVRPSATPLVIAVGADETSEFRRQSGEFRDEWRAAGNTCEFVCVPGRNHLTILDELSEDGGAILRLVGAQMGLGRSPR